MEFRVLGPVEVGPVDAPLPLRGHQRRGLLAMLLLRANRAVTRAELVRTLWAEPTRAADSNVRTHVSALRRLLGQHPGGPDGTERLATLASGYRLGVRPGELDLMAFEELAVAGEGALRQGEAAQALDALDRARRMWRGPALEGASTTTGLSAEADRLEERRLAVAELWARAAISAGQAADAVADLRALVTANPLRERIAGLLMRALVEAGEPAAALNVYQQVRAALAEGLGADPSPTLCRLHGRILRGELGRLPSARAPSGRPADRPSTVTVPRQLPAEPAGFVGRIAELARVDELTGLTRSVRNGSAWSVGPAGQAGMTAPGGLLVLAGTAGVGKTALAVRWAARSAARFPDGQLYAHLRGFGAGQAAEPVHLLAGFLHALGTAPEAVPTDPEEAAALYRSLLAGRQTLVVLDDAANEEQVRQLLPGGDSCLVVVTSRRRLRGLVARDGAHLFDLDVPSPEDAVGLLGSALGRPADPAELVEVAEACGRLPLALRIAAANLADEPTRPIREYLAELATDKLGALRIDGDPDSVVGAAFDHSYWRLADDDARLFRLLSVAPPADSGPAAIAALVDRPESEVRGALRRLAGAHLVERVGADRYGMHDLLRTYAAEKARLDPGAEPARLRLIDWYLAAADGARRLLHVDVVPLTTATCHRWDDRATAWTWLDTEADNLIALIRDTAVHGPYPAAWRLADMLRGYLRTTRRQLAAWVEIGQAAYAAAEAAGSEQGRAVARVVLGDAYRWACDFATARTSYRLAVRHAQRVGDTLVEACGHSGLSAVAVQSGAMAEAEATYAIACDLFRKAGSRSGEAAALGNLTIAQMNVGKLAAAADTVRRGKAIFLELGFVLGGVIGDANLGAIRAMTGDWPAAFDSYRSALDELRRHRRTLNAATEPFLLARLAETCAHLGDHDQADRYGREALDAACTIDDQAMVTESLRVLGTAAYHRGDPGAADRYAKAARIAHDHGIADIEARSLAGLARALTAATLPGVAPGRAAEAVAHATEAMRLAQANGLRVIEADCLAALAEAALAAGDTTLITLDNLRPGEATPVDRNGWHTSA